MRRGTFVIALIGALLLTAGCASTPEAQDAARKRELQREQRLFNALTSRGLARTEVVSRVPNFRISGWQDIDDRSLILTAGLRDHYLVTLFSACPGLDFAMGIGLSTATGSLGAGDSILVRGSFDDVQRCRIDEIWALEALPGYVEEESAEDS